MIETNNPEIDVNELMERVRALAASTSAAPATARATTPRPRNANALAFREIPAPPALALPEPAPSPIDHIRAFLRRAYTKNQVNSWVPAIFRGLFRRQGGFNRANLEVLSALADAHEQIVVRLREMERAATEQNQWLHALARQRQIETKWRKLAESRLSQTEELLPRLEGLDHRSDQLGEVEGHLRAQGEQLGRQDKQLRAFHADLEHASEHLRNLQNEFDRERGAQSSGLAERTRAFQGNFERMGEHLRNLQSEVERERAARPHLDQAIARLDERLTSDGSFIKAELSHHRSLLHGLSAAPLPASAREGAPSLAPDLLDAFYVSFEDRFRGTRGDIKERLRFYLPLLRSAEAGSEASPILDLGCGRGEWLELLREENLLGNGVDLNATMQLQCVERGLEVVHGDALQYLRNTETASRGAVSGFHIIEHLPFDFLMMLLAETLRVLRPGGLAIFESPNCKNLTVGASTFNLDPTHRNPVFPETARFMLELTGFERVEIEYLSPVDRQPFSQTQDGKLLNDLFCGPQDFAVIGRKSGSA